MKKKLNKIELVKAGKVLVFWQEKAWYKTKIFINWKKLIFLNYQKLDAKEPCLLILDKVPTHLYEKFIQF